MGRDSQSGPQKSRTDGVRDRGRLSPRPEQPRGLRRHTLHPPGPESPHPGSPTAPCRLSHGAENQSGRIWSGLFPSWRDWVQEGTPENQLCPPYPAPAAGARRKRRGRMRTRGRPQARYCGGVGGDGGLGRRPGSIFALATGLLHVCHRQRPLCRNLGQVKGLFLSMTSLHQAQNSTQGRLEPLFKRMRLTEVDRLAPRSQSWQEKRWHLKKQTNKEKNIFLHSFHLE